MKGSARFGLSDGGGRGLWLLVALTLLRPAVALGAAPEEAPLPEPPPLVETGAGAPERAPMPLQRPRETDAAQAPAVEAPVEPAGMEPPPARPAAVLSEPAASPEQSPGTAEPEPLGLGAVALAPLPPARPGLDGSNLIGIFSLTTGRTALVRLPGGDVRRVSVGDMIDGWEVSSITSDSLRVTRSGRERILVLTGN